MIEKARKVRVQSERYDNTQEQKWHIGKIFHCIFFKLSTVFCTLGLMGVLVTKHKEEEGRGVGS